MVISCLKETAVPIESAFSSGSSEDKTLSVMIQLQHLKLLGMRVKVILDEVVLQYISYYRAKDIILCANMRYIEPQNDIDQKSGLSPFTSTGFTSDNNGRLGIPEWNLLQRIDFEDGAELWEIFNDGRETKSNI